MGSSSIASWMAPSAVGTAFPKGHLCSSREGDTLGHLNPPRRPPPAGLRPDTEAQGQSAQSDIAVTPCADEIVTKFRINKDKVQYRRWNQTRGYWVDKKWIDL